MLGRGGDISLLVGKGHGERNGLLVGCRNGTYLGVIFEIVSRYV